MACRLFKDGEAEEEKKEEEKGKAKLRKICTV